MGTEERQTPCIRWSIIHGKVMDGVRLTQAVNSHPFSQEAVDIAFLKSPSWCKMLSPSPCLFLPSRSNRQYDFSYLEDLKTKYIWSSQSKSMPWHLEFGNESKLPYELSSKWKCVGSKGNYLFHTLWNRCICYLEIEMNVPIKASGSPQM